MAASSNDPLGVNPQLDAKVTAAVWDGMIGEHPTESGKSISFGDLQDRVEIVLDRVIQQMQIEAPLANRQLLVDRLVTQLTDRVFVGLPPTQNRLEEICRVLQTETSAKIEDLLRQSDVAHQQAVAECLGVMTNIEQEDSNGVSNPPFLTDRHEEPENREKSVDAKALTIQQNDDVGSVSLEPCRETNMWDRFNSALCGDEGWVKGLVSWILCVLGAYGLGSLIYSALFDSENTDK